MEDTDIDYLRLMMQCGAHVFWVVDGGGRGADPKAHMTMRRIVAIGKHAEEPGPAAYFGSGRAGLDYVALWGVRPAEIVVASYVTGMDSVQDDFKQQIKEEAERAVRNRKKWQAESPSETLSIFRIANAEGSMILAAYGRADAVALLDGEYPPDYVTGLLASDVEQVPAHQRVGYKAIPGSQERAEVFPAELMAERGRGVYAVADPETGQLQNVSTPAEREANGERHPMDAWREAQATMEAERASSGAPVEHDDTTRV